MKLTPDDAESEERSYRQLLAQAHYHKIRVEHLQAGAAELTQLIEHHEEQLAHVQKLLEPLRVREAQRHARIADERAKALAEHRRRQAEIAAQEQKEAEERAAKKQADDEARAAEKARVRELHVQANASVGLADDDLLCSTYALRDAQRYATEDSWLQHMADEETERLITEYSNPYILMWNKCDSPRRRRQDWSPPTKTGTFGS